MYWEKPKYWIDRALDKNIERGGIPLLTNRFCKDELGPISKWYQSLSIGPPTIDIHAPNPIGLGVRGVLGKTPSPILDKYGS